MLKRSAKTYGLYEYQFSCDECKRIIRNALEMRDCAHVSLSKVEWMSYVMWFRNWIYNMTPLEAVVSTLSEYKVNFEDQAEMLRLSLEEIEAVYESGRNKWGDKIRVYYQDPYILTYMEADLPKFHPCLGSLTSYLGESANLTLEEAELITANDRGLDDDFIKENRRMTQEEIDSIRESAMRKITAAGIDPHGEECNTQRRYLPFYTDVTEELSIHRGDLVRIVDQKYPGLEGEELEREIEVVKRMLLYCTRICLCDKDEARWYVYSRIYGGKIELCEVDTIKCCTKGEKNVMRFGVVPLSRLNTVCRMNKEDYCREVLSEKVCIAMVVADLTIQEACALYAWERGLEDALDEKGRWILGWRYDLNMESVQHKLDKAGTDYWELEFKEEIWKEKFPTFASKNII